MAVKVLPGSGSSSGFRNGAERPARSQLTDRRHDDSPQLFRKSFGANPSVFLKSGESLFGDLHFEAHRVGPAGVRDDELVLPVRRRRDLNQTLRSGRVVLSDLRAGGGVDEKVYVSILR